MSLNLHELVGDALTVVNDWQQLIFTKTIVTWKTTAETPDKTTRRLVLRGKLQPASTQDLRELGFNLAEYQYFKVFITGTPTQMDRLNQYACDTFACNGYKYRIVAKEPWDDAGWRECFAYRMTTEETNGNTNGIISVPTGPNA